METILKLCRKLHEAIYLVGLYNNGHYTDAATYSVFYNDLNLGNKLLLPWVTDESRIQIKDINDLIAEYLNYSWFSSPTFEWHLLNPYLRYCVELNRKHLFFESGFYCGLASCANNAQNYFITAICVNALKTMLYVGPATWLISTYFGCDFIIVGISLTFIKWGFNFIKSLFHRKAKKELICSLLALSNFKSFVSSKTWSPRKALERLNNLEGTFELHELEPLLRKIAQRDKYAFNMVH